MSQRNFDATHSTGAESELPAAFKTRLITKTSRKRTRSTLRRSPPFCGRTPFP